MKVYLHPVSLSNFDMLYIVIFCYFHSSNGITGRKKLLKPLTSSIVQRIVFAQSNMNL